MSNAALAPFDAIRMFAFREKKRLGFAALLIALLSLAVILFSPKSEPDPVGGKPMVRRLTEEQYRASIADIFSPAIPITGRFEKPVRSDGLIAIGTGSAGMSPFAIEQYDASAQGVAAAVMDSKNRSKFLKCGPKDPRAFDEACAQRVLSEKGRLLFRRKLTPDEVSKYVGLAQRAGEQLGSFYAGLELSLYTMLVAPDFLFRLEQVVVPGAEGQIGELDAYSKASRISFFLTNSTPDDELLRAAEEGGPRRFPAQALRPSVAASRQGRGG